MNDPFDHCANAHDQFLEGGEPHPQYSTEKSEEKVFERIVVRHECELFLAAEELEWVWCVGGLYYFHPFVLLRHCPFCGEKLMEVVDILNWENPYLKRRNE